MHSTLKTTLRKIPAAWPLTTLLLAGLFMLAVTSANANTPTCPVGATTFGPGLGVIFFTTNSAGMTNISLNGSVVGPCTPIWVAAGLVYVPQDAVGNTCSAFSDGQIYLGRNGGGFTVDVTPAGGVPLIGPVDPINCPGSVPVFVSRLAFYGLPSVADIAAGRIFVSGNYTNGTEWISPGVSNIVTAETANFVNIAQASTSTVVPVVTNVCAGGSASFTVAGLPPVNGPFTFSWTGPNGFTSTSATITLTNAQAVNAGVYTVVVTDAYGCTSVSSSDLVVIPAPARPWITNAGLDGTNFTFGVVTETNHTYTVEDTEWIEPATWGPLTNFPGTGEEVTISVGAANAQRFYRVVAH